MENVIILIILYVSLFCQYFLCLVGGKLSRVLLGDIYMQIQKMLQFNSKNVLILIGCFMLTACATKVQEQILVPPTALNRVINSIRVANFSGEYGSSLANHIRADLLSEGYINVSAIETKDVLNGLLSIHIESSSSTETQDVEREKDGKKYIETIIIGYHASKSGNASVTYSLTSDDKILIENQYTASSSSSSSESSISEADALEKLPGDGFILSEMFQMLPAMLPELSKKIIHDIFPHKGFLTFELQYGGNGRLTAGIDSYEQQLYSQAEEYWSEVANTQADYSETKASAYYNLGVLRIHQNNLQDAFKMFVKAYRLKPANSVYTEALQKLVNAGLIEQILISPCGTVPTATTIKPAANMNETTHSILEKKN